MALKKDQGFPQVGVRFSGLYRGFVAYWSSARTALACLVTRRLDGVSL